jgi:hypothetical protein
LQGSDPICGRPYPGGISRGIGKLRVLIISFLPKMSLLNYHLPLAEYWLNLGERPW